ncbi:MAG: DUF4386 domain-containing protein [Caldilinea sp. CFX5]|nr:DUF4386 domain-containing protein [Caldilinea sp. CFX5]
MNDMQLYQKRRKTARIAGLFYAILALVFFPQMVRDSLIVVGDAAATGRNILDNALLFRLSILGDLLGYIAFLFLAIWLYNLLKDVGRAAAQVMVAFVLVCVASFMVSAANEVAALRLIQGNDPAQAMLALALYEDGMLTAEVFMGLWLFPLGWLFYQSGFMPKTLGILLMIGCFGYLADAFAGLVMPDWQALTKQGVMIPGVVELITVFWLLVFGVKRPAQEKPPVAARSGHGRMVDREGLQSYR